MEFAIRENSFDSSIFQQVFRQNEYELADLTDQIVLDIGAHIGSFSLKAAAQKAKAVYSFEPHPENFALAKSNLQNQETCHVRNVAVGRSDKAQAMKLDMSDNATNHGGSCTVTDFGEDVATVSLDSLIEELHPTFIKIDAEGAEYPALYTCTKLDQIDTIVGEFHNSLGTKNMGFFSLDEETPDFLKDFKGKLNMRSLAAYLKTQGFRVVVDNIDKQIGHFWASRLFDCLNVMPPLKNGNPLFPGKECIDVDFSTGKCDGKNVVFCITLSELAERLDRFDKQARKVGQSYVAWAAFDARKMDREQVAAAVNYELTWDMPGNPGALTRPSEVGLLWSSVSLWLHALKNDLPYLVVMEDDAILQKALCMPIPEDADLVFFNNRSYRNSKGNLWDMSCGTDGYVVTRKGLKKLLEIYKQWYMPVDLQWQPQVKSLRECEHCLSSYYNPRLPSLQAYCLRPYVQHSHSASTIR
jgi:FkbM family methyltransferase